MNDSNFQQFFEGCYTYCLPRLMQLTASKADAEDCFQEAVTKYWLYCQQGKLKHTSHPKAFVLVTARNYWHNMQKRKGRLIPTNSEHLYHQINQYSNTQDVHQFDHLIRQEEACLIQLKRQHNLTQLQKAWQQLPTRCQNVLIERIVYQSPIKDIAINFDFSSQQVARTTISRCKKKLKHWFYQLTTQEMESLKDSSS